MDSMDLHNVYSQVWIHTILCTRDLQPLILPACELKLYKLMCSLTLRKRCPMTAINGTANHVHLLFPLHPTANLEELMQQLADISTVYLNHSGLLPRPFQWEEGYHAFSLHTSEISLFAAYLGRQKELHRFRTFEEEILSLAGEPDC